jgi:hypothetical protein
VGFVRWWNALKKVHNGVIIARMRTNTGVPERRTVCENMRNKEAQGERGRAKYMNGGDFAEMITA